MENYINLRMLQIVREIRNKPNFVLEDIKLDTVRAMAIEALHADPPDTLDQIHRQYLEDQAFLMQVMPKLPTLRTDPYFNNILREIATYYHITEGAPLPETDTEMLLALDQQTRTLILDLIQWHNIHS